jgi:hypothetical protein
METFIVKLIEQPWHKQAARMVSNQKTSDRIYERSNHETLLEVQSANQNNSHV